MKGAEHGGTICLQRCRCQLLIKERNILQVPVNLETWVLNSSSGSIIWCSDAK